MGASVMLVSYSKVLCFGAAQKKPSYSPPVCARCLASLSATRGGGSTQGRSQKSALQLSQKDWLAALKPPEHLDFKEDEATALDDNKLAEALVGSIGSDSNVDLVDPSAFLLGIDPDITGAMAVLRGHDVTMAEVFDVPSVRVMVGSQHRRRHDACSIVSMIRNLNAPAGSVAYIEQNAPLPKDGKQGWWASGFGYGIWIGTLVACGVSVVPVPSSVWKRAMGLFGKAATKDDCRAYASSIFPSLAPQLRRKKDHGRAEALLIAAYAKGIVAPVKNSIDGSSMPNNHEVIIAG